MSSDTAYSPAPTRRKRSRASGSCAAILSTRPPPRIVNRTGDGLIAEFRSVVDALRCAIELLSGTAEPDADLPEDRRIAFRIGVHLGDVVEEADGDLLGDGVNIAARLESVAKRSSICLSEQAYWQVKGRLDLAVSDLGPVQLKNIVTVDPGLFARPRRVRHAKPAPAAPPEKSAAQRVVLPFANIGGGARAGALRRRRHGKPDDRPLKDTRRGRDRSKHRFHL